LHAGSQGNDTSGKNRRTRKAVDAAGSICPVKLA